MKKINSKFKDNRFFLLCIFGIMLSLLTIAISFSTAAIIENDVEVKPNTELIYYLNVNYDGVDSIGKKSDDNTISEISSGIIYVEDKLPDGLIFNGFVTTADGTIGAVSRGTGEVCTGEVVDDSTEEIKTRLVTWLDYYGRIIKTVQVNWGEPLDIEELTPAEPTLLGYTFDRWDGPYIDENLNIVYKAFYKSDTPQMIDYIVEWYDNEGELLKAPETRTGTYGSIISVTESDKVISGYTFDENNSKNILTTTLTPTSNKLRLYFKSPSQMANYSLSKSSTEENDYKYNYHGLHYDEKTRTISFKVRNLQAGCKLTVGIKTLTPSSVDDKSTEEIELRRDFYNFATFKEGSLSGNSNTVHVWMGSDNLAMYKVIYKYEGDVPSNAPIAPKEIDYASGTQVGIAGKVNVEGYEFSGWTTEDASIINGSLKMPDHDVVLVGSFKEKSKYKVNYQIRGQIPNGYIEPNTKEYYSSAYVKLDSLKKDDVFNGYRFLGWSTEDAEISTDNDFTMPENNVTIIGEFEEVKYKVIYNFFDNVLPSNSESLLPDIKEYKPGEEVTLDSVKGEPEGYKFLGWYKEDTFEMPEHDVVIYGEWMIRNGVFAPEIKKEINNPKDYYFPGDIVNYTITVTNTADYPIKNVIVRDNNEKATLNYISICNQGVLSGLDKGEENINEEIKCNIESRSDHIAQINYIGANSSIKINASYLVTDEDFGIIPNEVEILGATADNNYVLDQEREYKSEVSFKVASQINICKKVDGKSIEKEFQFRISNEDESFESWMILNSGACDTIYVEPGDYKVEEIIPQEFILSDSTRNKDGNEDSNYPNGELFVVDELSRYNFTFTNTYKKKGFLHSFGRVVNSILGSQDGLSLLG